MRKVTDGFGDLRNQGGLTIEEGMRYGRIGRNTLLDLLAKGEIKGRKIGARRWIIFRPSLDQWLAGGR